MQIHPESQRRQDLYSSDRDLAEKIAKKTGRSLGYHYDGSPRELLHPENQETLATIIAQELAEHPLPSLDLNPTYPDINGLGNAARWGLFYLLGLNDGHAHPNVLDWQMELFTAVTNVGDLVSKKLTTLLAGPKAVESR